MEERGPYSDDWAAYGENYQARPRRASLAPSVVESLPPYDENRSPTYEESPARGPDGRAPPTNADYQVMQYGLVQTQSGLGIAMREESLRTLKNCTEWLRWANRHLSDKISDLKTTLDEYSSSSPSSLASPPRSSASSTDPAPPPAPNEAERSALRARMDDLRQNILKTLGGVISVVSNAGGRALPANAQALVRTHLTSLPARFQHAFRPALADADQAEAAGGARTSAREDRRVAEGAARVLVLAREGLDMVEQVSMIVDQTIAWAEHWCERLGREGEGVAQREPESDVEMGEGDASSSAPVEGLPHGG